MSVSYGGDKITFEDGSTVGSGWAGFKNRLINGSIQIDQRFAGANTGNTVFDAYTVDRWFEQNLGVFVTCQQVTDAPAGFYNSYKKTINIANNFSSSGYSNFQQVIERNNVTDLKWGTADAAPLTLSFWVKSSLVGLHSVALQNYNSGTRRSNVSGYTINQANTWEYKTITFSGDTVVNAGNGNALNGASVQVRFSQGSIAQYSTTTLDSWQSADKFFNENAVKVASTAGATWQVTGVQLEKGSQATSFEYRPYGTELQLCQRYCQTITRAINSLSVGLSYKQGGNYILTNISYPTMRVSPSWDNPPTSWKTDSDMTATQAAAYDFTNGVFVTISGSLGTINQLSPNHGRIYVSASSSFSGGSGGGAFGLAFGADLIFSAEL
jgi:hypothetical protein